MRERDITAPQRRYRGRLHPDMQVKAIDTTALNTVGHESFARASAIVLYKEDQNNWGRLDQQQAAVLTFHTDLLEPEGYKLRSLQVKLAFSDSMSPCGSIPKVKMLKRPSPRKVRGGETVRSGETNWNINPQIPTPIGDLTIGNYEQRENFDRKGYWTYESHLEGLEQNAVWLWTANDANSSNEDTGGLDGGVVLGHAGDDFFVSCTIEGKLVSRTSDLIWSARRWFKFRSRDVSGKDAYLRITPQSRPGPQPDLTQAVEGLEQKMQELMEKSLASESPISPSISTY